MPEKFFTSQLKQKDFFWKEMNILREQKRPIAYLPLVEIFLLSESLPFLNFIFTENTTD